MGREDSYGYDLVAYHRHEMKRERFHVKLLLLAKVKLLLDKRLLTTRILYQEHKLRPERNIYCLEVRNVFKLVWKREKR